MSVIQYVVVYLPYDLFTIIRHYGQSCHPGYIDIILAFVLNNY